MLRCLVIVLLGCVALLGGCGSLVPTSGPLSEEITSVRSGKDANYLVVEINNSTVRRLTAFRPVGLSYHFKGTKAKLPYTRIGKGDVLSVTIWEAGEGGLFSNSQSKNITIPAVTVGRSGAISLPYAGPVKVLDSTPIEVEQRIVKELSGRAIHPQVTVQIVKNESNTVILSGDVIKPGRIELSSQGDRLLDVVASAGGAKYPAEEVFVTFVRGQQRGSQLLKTVLDDQRENIYVSAGDRIYLAHEPRRYSVFGAVAKPGIYPVGVTQINLLEAVAAAGGLADNRADATGLFVFRHETPEVAQAVHGPYDTARFGPVVPIVYKINLRDPSAYFYARGFAIHNKDVLYVANAKGVEMSKIMRFVNLVSSSVGVGRRVAD